jgi:lipoprotein-anchoring transpeptidase ErfK/SrfK
MHRIITIAIGIVTFLTIVFAANATAKAATAPGKPVQIVRVIAATNATVNPGFGEVVKRLGTKTPYGDDQLALRVMQSVPGEVDPITGVQRVYYQVHLPYRRSRLDSSNGNVGWVSSDTVQVFTSPWAVRVNRAHRTLTVLKNGKRYASWKVIVGRPSMETPQGEFAVYGKSHRASVDGPYGLMTFTYSSVLSQFSGSNGKVALHSSSATLTDPMGTAASHGCVRSTPEHFRWLIEHLPIGTPVDVV